jgi:acetyl esterase
MSSEATLPSVSLPTPKVRPSLRARFRRSAGALVVDGFFQGVSTFAGALPISQPHRHGLEVLRDIPYQQTGMREHLLDIYRLRERSGPLPVVFYVHGGGFRILSKDTHWLFGIAFSRRGYILVNINYRLSPQYPFPAAHEDAAAALEWTLAHIAEFGGDPTRIAFAGESAGANLATSLAIASCTPRPEPWARRIYDLGIVPRAVLPACGILQVSDTQRFGRKNRLPGLVLDRVVEVTECYLGGCQDLPRSALEMADPLLILENPTTTWTRPLPPFFAPCGTFDPIVDDTRRLEVALQRMNVTCDARYYKHETHAFHAFYPMPNARRCWQDTFSFLREHMPPTAAELDTVSAASGER